MSFVTRLLLILFCFSFLPSVSNAAGKITVLEIRKAKVPVYKRASFDSKIIAYAKRGKKLYGTKKTRPGIEGFGLFHKVRLRKGLYGFILDTDVVGFKKSLKKKSKRRTSRLKSGGSKSKLSKKSRAQKKRSRKSKEVQGSEDISKMQKWKGYPLSFVKAYGLSVGMVDYAIEFGGGEVSSNESSFGFKLSGPGWIYKTLPIDLTVLAHFGGTEGLNTISQTKSSGFFVVSDITFPFRLKHSKKWSIYGGVGILATYEDLQLRLNDDDKSFSGLSFGAVGTLGFVFNQGDWLFKIEPKFYWEGSQFFGVLGSVQRVL